MKTMRFLLPCLLAGLVVPFLLADSKEENPESQAREHARAEERPGHGGKGHGHEGKGHGVHGKGHGPGHGGDDFRGTIHALFASHGEIDRKVELTQEGYRATTTSGKPEVVALLRKHLSEMKERLESGRGVRHWDPAFAEFREHYEDIEVRVKNIEGGVEVTVEGRTPEAAEVARNHAKIVSGFVEKGEERMHATHPRALPGGE